MILPLNVKSLVGPGSGRVLVTLLGYTGAYVVCLIFGLLLPQPVVFTACMVTTWAALLTWRMTVLGRLDGADAFFVIVVSAVQNVVLGILAPTLSAFAIKGLLTVNFLLPVMWLVFLSVTRISTFRSRHAVKVYLTVIAIFTVILFSVATAGFNGVAAISSIRNIVSPVTCFAVGFLVAWRHDRSKFFVRAIVVLGLCVVAFGVVERFVASDIWHQLNIAELWHKKELSNIGGEGIPRNWYSAERVAGRHVRRMVSSLADPVNLGTFLFLVFAASYAVGSVVGALTAIIGIVLTVSKGGALGLLVFATVYGYYRGSRLTFLTVAIAASAAGAGFIYYSMYNATGSLFLHISGMTNALAGLTDNPLGSGIGRAGTLAQQFTDLGEQQIVESGLGMIIGQLGLAGFLVYLGFTLFALRSVTICPDIRQRIFGASLLGAIVLNIMFNEVALSPNSSAGYFYLIGELAATGVAARLHLRQREPLSLQWAARRSPIGVKRIRNGTGVPDAQATTMPNDS